MKNANGIILTLALFLLIALSVAAQTRHYPFSMEYNPQRTILTSFKTPPGYERYPLSKMDRFMLWVTNLPLSKKERPVVKWNRQVLIHQDSISGVVDLGVISGNQTDVDLPVQFIFEFLRSEGKLEDFPVIVSRTDTLFYSRWLNGKYSTGARNEIRYKKGEKRTPDDREFYRYLEYCMHWIEHKNILFNLESVKAKDLAPGDLYIQFDKNDPDSSGHAAMIVDICYGEDEEILLLAGWGGIPAHDFYIPKPQSAKDRQWMTIDELKELLSKYGEGRFYRFKNLRF
jgi:hypothetical protein